MDYMQGGDLRFHLGHQRKFSQKTSKFFIACIILALEYLAENKILHRDIKPENLVIDKDGFLRLTDFGIARLYRKDNGRDTSGTPGYMAPEVLLHLNHSYSADYFALGVLTYELMTGQRPFYGKDREEIKEKIFNQQFQLKQNQVPIGWTSSVIDFINKLLQIDPNIRLGSNGIHELKNHEWFKSFDWNSLYDRTYQSSFKVDMNVNNFKQNISEKDEISDTQYQNFEKQNNKNTMQKLFDGYEFQSRLTRLSLL